MDNNIVIKLECYKTAYDPLFGVYVKIVNVRYDDTNEPIIDAIWEDGHRMLYRKYKLTRYCL